MAAIDPDETPELEDGIDPSKPRATLKIIRPPPGMDIEESDEEEVVEEAKDDDDELDLKKDNDDDEDEDEDDDEEFDLKAAISKLVKGKAPATDDDDEEDEDDESLDVDEAVICTLDPEKVRLVLMKSSHLHGSSRKFFLVALPASS